MEEHETLLREVFEELKKNELFCKTGKAQLFMDRVEFLGHVVTQNGIRPLPAKLSAFLDVPPPTSSKALASFLGAANYWRKYIEGYAQTAAPLVDLLAQLRRLEKEGKRREAREAAKEAWDTGSKCMKAFQDIRKALTGSPVLAPAQWNLPFILATDASDSAVGACLMQRQESGLKIIGF